ncbi:hypothetical protein SERLADRAFT_396341 [Serpula lacrymans var. lacrymans S7.9]|uniref:Uncharacterized protein n=1 Tax=Serpula lacrymans var. lacrymans (strain S7.9) TaxID=578457 RepID=F8P4E6_SERL9|nr:uncharacterized protein SERLADRAFT_396341 [Serpula lacrymans var. lacrymans S7.9]EGO21484.1 hypothetical protein SERLADRAFT_396341 [Serpula lacrymans var. lacrymans S7.9]
MDMLEKNKKDQEVLNAALQAFVSRPRSPPPSALLPPEYLLQTVEEPILASVRSHIQPLFSQLRIELAEMLRTRNADIYNALWPKLGLTLRMIDTIQARINLGSAEAPPNAAASTE